MEESLSGLTREEYLQRVQGALRDGDSLLAFLFTGVPGIFVEGQHLMQYDDDRLNETQAGNISILIQNFNQAADINLKDLFNTCNIQIFFLNAEISNIHDILQDIQNYPLEYGYRTDLLYQGHADVTQKARTALLTLWRLLENLRIMSQILDDLPSDLKESAQTALEYILQLHKIAKSTADYVSELESNAIATFSKFDEGLQQLTEVHESAKKISIKELSNQKNTPEAFPLSESFSSPGGALSFDDPHLTAKAFTGIPGIIVIAKQLTLDNSVDNDYANLVLELIGHFQVAQKAGVDLNDLLSYCQTCQFNLSAAVDRLQSMRYRLEEMRTGKTAWANIATDSLGLGETYQHSETTLKNLGYLADLLTPILIDLNILESQLPQGYDTSATQNAFAKAKQYITSLIEAVTKQYEVLSNLLSECRNVQSAFFQERANVDEEAKQRQEEKEKAERVERKRQTWERERGEMYRSEEQRRTDWSIQEAKKGEYQRTERREVENARREQWHKEYDAGSEFTPSPPNQPVITVPWVWQQIKESTVNNKFSEKYFHWPTALNKLVWDYHMEVCDADIREAESEYEKSLRRFHVFMLQLSQGPILAGAQDPRNSLKRMRGLLITIKTQIQKALDTRLSGGRYPQGADENLVAKTLEFYRVAQEQVNAMILSLDGIVGLVNSLLVQDAKIKGRPQEDL